jgi:hypothetical protein
MSIPHSWAGTRVGNLVTSSVDTDPLTGMVRQSGVLVTVTSAPELATAVPATL